MGKINKKYVFLYNGKAKPEETQAITKNDFYGLVTTSPQS